MEFFLLSKLILNIYIIYLRSYHLKLNIFRRLLFFWAMFASHDPKGCINDVRCSPLSAIQNYNDFPTSIIVSASADPLRSESLSFINKLRKSNVETFHVELRGSHGSWVIDLEKRNEYLSIWRSKMIDP